MQVHQCRADHLRAVAGLRPGQRRDAVSDRRGHQLVVRRMKLDLIHPVPETVMRTQLGALRVGLESQFHQPSAGQLTIGAETLRTPAATQAVHPMSQRLIAVVQIRVDEFRGLVDDRVSQILDIAHGIFLEQNRATVDHGEGLSSTASAWG